MRGTPKTTRLRRLDCADGCGYTIRLSRRWMDAGLPSCPCGGLLVPASIEDADRALERGHLTVAEYNAIPEVAELHHHLASIAQGRSGSKDAGTELARTSVTIYVCGCGQAAIAGMVDRCERCNAEIHAPQGETVRLFTPAPAQLPGQLNL